MKTGRGNLMPRLRDVICQFFLVKKYECLFKRGEMLSPFTEHQLEKHHVIPLGSLRYPDDIIRVSEEKLRNDRSYFLNTPINFVYITSEENKIISDANLADYTARITSYASKSLLGFVGNFDTSSEEACKSILGLRFDDIVGKVQQHINYLIP